MWSFVCGNLFYCLFIRAEFATVNFLKIVKKIKTLQLNTYFSSHIFFFSHLKYSISWTTETDLICYAILSIKKFEVSKLDVKVLTSILLFPNSEYTKHKEEGRVNDTWCSNNNSTYGLPQSWP